MTENVAIGVSLSFDMGKGHNLVFQTHVPQTADAGFLNSTLDKLRHAGERQAAHCELVAQELELLRVKRLVEMTETTYVDIELRENEERDEFYKSGRKGDWKRDQRQEQHRLELINKVKHDKILIETIEKRIEELKQKAA